MEKTFLAIVLALVTPSIGMSQDFQKCVTNTAFHFIDTKKFDISSLDPPPPYDRGWTPSKVKSNRDDELQDLYRLQNSRTQKQVDQANKDAGELDIFIFQNVIGDNFSASNPALPATTKLSQDLCEESTALATVQKNEFKRARPFIDDKGIKPATDVSNLTNSFSYPSGHSLTGYLEALALAEIFPEKRDAILQRAMEFARERNILGVHYLSDIAIGRSDAYALYEQISKSKKFKDELEASRTELRKQF
jgi:acid phosphatase (class A)